jgi:NADH-ubiquinone oxidoreductase chain 1
LLVLYLSCFISFELGFFWACMRLGVCSVMIAGWSSNSGYSLLGGLRALAQTISYEVRLAFILLSFVVLVCRYNCNTVSYSRRAVSSRHTFSVVMVSFTA